MSKGKKTAVIVAVSCIVVGAVIAGIALMLSNFDLSALSTERFETVSHAIDGDFDSVRVVSEASDIRVVPSKDGSGSVSCTDSKNRRHEVTVENGVLTVTYKDTSKWYENIGVFWDDLTVTVYLPKAEYNELYIKSSSGSVSVPSEFRFASAEIKSVSGDIFFKSEVTGALAAETTSGDIELRDISAESITADSTSGDIEVSAIVTEEGISVESTSGDIELQYITAGSLYMKSVSGDVSFGDANIAVDAEIRSTSGDIELERCDAGSFTLKAVSGDIEGSIMSPKDFSASSSSGRIRVPDSVDGAGSCDIKTTSGDIEIRVLG